MIKTEQEAKLSLG